MRGMRECGLAACDVIDADGPGTFRRHATKRRQRGGERGDDGPSRFNESGRLRPSLLTAICAAQPASHAAQAHDRWCAVYTVRYGQRNGGCLY